MTATIVTIEPGAARDAWIPLLELADEPEPLRRYVNEGVLYGIADDASGAPLAAILVIDLDDRTAELRAVAVAERAQGGGVGTRMVTEICDRLRAAGKRVVVGTASSGTRQLAFYQRLGFRLRRVERDYFNAARGYDAGLEENGIPTRDMVWMDLDEQQPLRVATVCIDCADADAMADFYGALLGWRVTIREPGWVLMRDPAGGTGLSFQAEAGYRAPTWPEEPAGLDKMLHLDIQVEDLEAAIAHAVAAGARIAPLQPRPRQAVLLDPAGHPFCLFLD